MEVYGEVVAMLNFLVDFLLLYGTNRLSGLPGKTGRAALGAALGGAYAFACLLPGLSFLAGGFWRLLSFAGMSLIAFGPGRAGIKKGVVFFLLSMALGGFAMGMGSRTVWTLVLAAAVLWLLCLLGFGCDGGAKYADMQITYRGKRLHLTALADTGNTLRDPISGCPVLVADAAAAWELLGLEEQALADPMGALACGKYPGLRLIPYHAVGNPGGFLLAIRPDEIRCNGQSVSMVVAFAPHRIGENKAFRALAGGTV